MENRALYYGKLACDTMMRKYEASELPPKGGFHYHAGVFLSGMMNIYSRCGAEKYYEYVKAWVDSVIPEPGVINRFQLADLDGYMAGILLFPLYERTKDERYLAAIRLLMGNLRNWYKNAKGGFWHMAITRNQMWLDGLYMAGPTQAIYARTFGQPHFAKEAARQAVIMYENMQDQRTKLLYHAWDNSCVQGWPEPAPWANEKTGLSPEIWGRSVGWYVVAILDILEQMDKSMPEYQKLVEIEKEVLSAVLTYRDTKKKVWYQIVDKGHLEDNWIESSCSCLFTYALAKAVRMGIFDSKVGELAQESFDAVLKEFVTIEGENLEIKKICVGTGVNDYAYYVNRPTSVNDLHGMGAFLLMCAEIARIQE